MSRVLVLWHVGVSVDVTVAAMAVAGLLASGE